MIPARLTSDAVRRIAVASALLGGKEERPREDRDAILGVVGHFGTLQIDPTRTVDKTHYLVLWSRLGKYQRQALDDVTYRDRRLLEYNAHYLPIERLPELRYEADPWSIQWPRVSSWIA